jgi:hypothetical protein
MVMTLASAMLARTEEMIQNKQALRRKAQPVELAKSIAFLLGEDSSFMTGSVMGKFQFLRFMFFVRQLRYQGDHVLLAKRGITVS